MSQYLSNTSKHRRAASGSANNTKNNLQWTGFTTLMNVHDLSIFYTIKGYHTNDDECKSSDSKPCVAMNRLIVTLKYYSMLDINNNEDDAEIFRHFIHEIYYDLIDDYIHFKYHHDDQLQSIYEELMHDKTFKQCDNFQTCSFTTRHHRTAKQQTQITDPDLNFYKELMDGFISIYSIVLMLGFDPSKVIILMAKPNTKTTIKQQEKKSNFLMKLLLVSTTTFKVENMLPRHSRVLKNRIRNSKLLLKRKSTKMMTPRTLIMFLGI
eukprot:663181_1